MLLRINRATLETDYLLDRSNKLGIAAELMEIWQEAFPDEQGPARSTPGTS